MRAPSWSLAAAAFVAGMDEIERVLFGFFRPGRQIISLRLELSCGQLNRSFIDMAST